MSNDCLCYFSYEETMFLILVIGIWYRASSFFFYFDIMYTFSKMKISPMQSNWRKLISIAIRYTAVRLVFCISGVSWTESLTPISWTAKNARNMIGDCLELKCWLMYERADIINPALLISSSISPMIMRVSDDDFEEE